MGFAFLPWERLPAYVLGPLLFAIFGGLFYSDDHHTVRSVFVEASILLFAVWLVVQRYRTGKEPLAHLNKQDGTD